MGTTCGAFVAKATWQASAIFLGFSFFIFASSFLAESHGGESPAWQHLASVAPSSMDSLEAPPHRFRLRYPRKETIGEIFERQAVQVKAIAPYSPGPFSRSSHLGDSVLGSPKASPGTTGGPRTTESPKFERSEVDSLRARSETKLGRRDARNAAEVAGGHSEVRHLGPSSGNPREQSTAEDEDSSDDTNDKCPDLQFPGYPSHAFPQHWYGYAPVPPWVFAVRTPPRGKWFLRSRSFNIEKSVANCCGPLKGDDPMWVVCRSIYWNNTATGMDQTDMKTFHDVAMNFNSNFMCVYNLAWLTCGPAFEGAVCCSSFHIGSGDIRFGKYCMPDDPEVPCWGTETEDLQTTTTTVTTPTTVETQTSNETTPTPALSSEATSTEKSTDTSTASQAWNIGADARILSGSIAVGGGLVGSVIYTLTSHTFVESNNAFVQAATKQPLFGRTPENPGIGVRDVREVKNIPDIVANQVEQIEEIGETVDMAAEVAENLAEVAEPEDHIARQVFAPNASAEFWEALEDW